MEYIVCYRLDRISRNVSDFSSLITDLNDRNIAFVSVKEQFDTSTPMGRATMYIASVFAQLERETIAERIRDNMLMLARTGRWLGGTSPTGYKSEKVEQIVVDGKSKQMFRLKIVPNEADLVKLIFKKFMKTNSLTKVETYLIQRGIKTKNGRAFTRFTIKNILENPVYMVADEVAFKFFQDNGVEFSDDDGAKSKFDGQHVVMSYNKTIQKDGRRHYTRGIKDWIISVGQHEGLVRLDYSAKSIGAKCLKVVSQAQKQCGVVFSFAKNIILSFFSHKKECDCTWAGVRADNSADVINLDFFDVELF